MKTINKNTVLGVIKLFRVIPVLTYSGSLMFISIAFAHKYSEIQWYHLLPMLAGGFLINGFLSHSLNDINDWESGTDQVSRGILSGGSKVLKQRLLHKVALNRIALLSLFAILMIGLYLYMFRGILVLAAVAVGVFAAWAYSCPPFRLAYNPILGELIGIWVPGVVLSTASYFVLTGEFHPVPFFAALIQTTLILGWIMLHHVPDIPADLSAIPCKLTTPALCFRLCGPKGSTLPSIFYSGLAVTLSFLGFIYIHQVFVWMVLPCLIGIWAGVTANAKDVHDVTKRQLVSIAAIVANSIIFAILV
ncbi:MAG: prenyltransferase [Thermoanaerobacteraceae bacterium]|nr:prenyltransferase [Thermoanaerobacteraceae bacterium]